jgi:hypothetical protein
MQNCSTGFQAENRMLTTEELFSIPPYALSQQEKSELLIPLLNKLTKHHFQHCSEYRKILIAEGMDEAYHSFPSFPFIPIRLFKDYELFSIPKEDIIKTLTSSGTTSQKVSKIFLDRITAAYQTKALVKIMQDFLGKQRLPMLIVDHPNVIKDRTSFSARGAGILGLMNFGRSPTYLLNESMEIDFDVLNAFLDRHAGQKTFIFGFTFMVWQYLYQALLKKNIKIDLSQGILVHSGGWKKLQAQAVDNREFKEKIKNQTGIQSIHNFYGMVEQIGSIFMECEAGYLHAPIFSDVFVRNPYDWSVLPQKQSGIIEVMSILPHSYPGHVLLTEDMGTIHGEDDCSCGRKGKYFLISGRIPRAEVRGCSDTHGV